jgi:hypothetical protein
MAHELRIGKDSKGNGLVLIEVSKKIFFQLLVWSVEESSMITRQLRDRYVMLLYALTKALNVIQERIPY